jgi:hypothetical protein
MIQELESVEAAGSLPELPPTKEVETIGERWRSQRYGSHRVMYEELLIIDPERFQNGKDGPCHPPAFRKRFWTDVLRSLELSFDLLVDEARAFNQERLRFMPDEYIGDLEARIAVLRTEL